MEVASLERVIVNVVDSLGLGQVALLWGDLNRQVLLH